MEVRGAFGLPDSPKMGKEIAEMPPLKRRTARAVRRKARRRRPVSPRSRARKAVRAGARKTRGRSTARRVRRTVTAGTKPPGQGSLSKHQMSEFRRVGGGSGRIGI